MIATSYQRCTVCIMDTTDPEITFDSDGVCSHCHKFEKVVRPNWHPGTAEGKRKLAATIEKIKDAGTRAGREYDCVMGLSGGVDSSYLALLAAREFGLKPLMVHVDAGWNSELAVSNIENIVKKLGLDLYTYVVNWPEMRDLQRSYLKAGVANQDVPQDHAFFAKLWQLAGSKKSSYVLTGSNFATESILPTAWGYNAMDSASLYAIQRAHGTLKLKTYPTTSFFEYYVYYPRIRRIKTFKPLNFIDYNKDLAKEKIKQELNWRDYGVKHGESRWTKWFQNYYLPTRFGYDKRLAHLASLVVSKQLNRDKALALLELPLYDAEMLREETDFVAKKLGFSTDELNTLVSQPLKKYNDYYSNEWIFKIKDFVKPFVKKIV